MLTSRSIEIASLSNRTETEFVMRMALRGR